MGVRGVRAKPSAGESPPCLEFDISMSGKGEAGRPDRQGGTAGTGEGGPLVAAAEVEVDGTLR